MLMAYLYSLRKRLLCGGVCVLLFVIVFALYELPLEAVLYAAALCLAVLLPAGVVGYRRFARRCRQLVRAREQLDAGLGGLPAARNREEREYQELLEALEARLRAGQTGQAARYNEMVDYYTLWAHQIKTPLAAMNLLLQTERALPADEAEEQLFKVEQYVEMVLQYLRTESLSADMVIRRCRLEEMVRQAVRKYSKIFIRKKLRLELGDLEGEVLTDEKWFTFLLEQVLSNALKYTRKGTITIRRDAAANCLLVEDTGIGIRPEDLPRVCEKGFTGYNGREERRSTGIGLYLCRRIADKLSHTLDIESEQGTGTRVRIGLESRDMVFD